MTDRQDDVVEKALNDCEEVFKRGVLSFSEDFKIDDGVIDILKGALREEFKTRLVDQGRKWDDDKDYVIPMAFYTGVLGACYVHNIDKLVTEEYAKRALRHVSEHCHGPVKEATDPSRDDLKPRWWYCPPWGADGGEVQD